MANSKATEKNVKSTNSSKQLTAVETQDMYAKNGKNIENFDKAMNALKKLIDPTKTSSKTSSTFSKETLRAYMRNPLANFKNLRNLSRFLYYRSQVYKRIVNRNANMIDLNYRSIIPQIDITKNIDKKKMLKSYHETLIILEKMNLPLEMLKAYTKCWVEDVFFGCVYYDDNGFFVLPLDPDFCKVTGIYPTGDLSFDMDMTFFTRNQDLLELWGSPFDKMYQEYQSNGSTNKFVSMPDENCLCLKVNIDDWETPLPPYITLFESLINLQDLNEITAIADQQNIYKLLVATMPLNKNSNDVNDFAVDVEVAIEYYNRMIEKFPDYTDAVLSPIPIDSITFDKDQASDVNKVEYASNNILKSSGHTVLAQSNGTTAMTAAIQADEDYAISSLLPQTQAWINRFLSYHIKNPAKVKFLEVTKYTKDKFKDSIIKDMNYSSSLITTLGVLNGYSELEQISMANMNDILGLDELFKPVATAATRSAGEAGRPKNDEATDESESSEDERDRNG